jgi:glycerol-3-phosphate acyltransferase PlsX
VSSAPGTSAAGRIPTIGVDAMGGDFGPSVIVPGVALALREFPGRFRIVLLGDLEEVRDEWTRARAQDLPVEFVDAPERVEMDEPPSTVLRRKPNSSLAIATQMQKEKRIDAFFSAGSTGAVVAVSLLGLGRLERVSRPAIASIFPNRGKGCVVLDVGATADCKPMHLVQFGEMGSCYAHDVLGLAAPRVGLLSIGEEPGKGDELRRAAYDALAALPIDFVGNVEGRDVPYGGRADVVVTDGFTGNVLAKGLEGAATMLTEVLYDALTSTPERQVVAEQLLPALGEATAHMSPEALGGAVLLGVGGVVVVGHGASTPQGVASCARTAVQAVREGLVDSIGGALGELLDRTRAAVGAPGSPHLEVPA